MDWLPGTLAIGFFCLAVWMTVSRLLMKRRLRNYTHLLQKVDPDLHLADAPGLEDLSSAVQKMITNLQTLLSSSEKERLRLSTLLEQMTDGVLIVDGNGVVVFLNPAAEGMFAGAGTGHSVAEVLRHHLLVETWQRCQKTGQTQSETVEVPTRRQFLQIFALPDRYSNGTLLMVQDLTRLRRLETVRRDFISNVSHELRTPLASLKALTETLRDGALDDPQAAPRFLNRIETEVDALTQMAQELLELSRIESGQVILVPATVPVERLLHTSAERMHLQAERAGINLAINIPENIPQVKADEGRLEQVLVNLIHNSVKFSPPGGTINLGAATEGSLVRFFVQDSGVGIPEDDLERIFERFYKADRARSSGGTGLGLSIARHIVEAHGGRIWAESREGQGSTFHFTIPST